MEESTKAKLLKWLNESFSLQGYDHLFLFSESIRHDVHVLRQKYFIAGAKNQQRLVETRICFDFFPFLQLSREKGLKLKQAHRVNVIFH